MKQRYIDIDIWKKRWFRELLPEEKSAFIYLTCMCDAVGVWDVDFEIAEVQIGVSIDWDAFKKKLNGNIETIRHTKSRLPGFCTFQYPGFPNENTRPHQSYIRDLKRHGLWDKFKGQGKPKARGRKAPGKDLGKGLDLNSMAIEVMTFLNEETSQKYTVDAAGHRDWLAPRFKEGRTVQDCKNIVTVKALQWLKDDKMRDHLTPQTLFKPKTFDSYLGEFASIPERKKAQTPGWECPICKTRITNTGSYCGVCKDFTRSEA